jgi:hypothetical protein|tara:strand:+ start:626 stop:820 length:195 start_codon:yes stop_codon:yes gene_type:complete
MGKKEEKYRNVGILIENHELLRELAASEDRSMVKQLGHLIKNAHETWNRGTLVSPEEDNFYGKG